MKHTRKNQQKGLCARHCDKSSQWLYERNTGVFWKLTCFSLIVIRKKKEGIYESIVSCEHLLTAVLGLEESFSPQAPLYNQTILRYSKKHEYTE